MLRFVTMCGLVGMGGGFLYISPPLRQSLSEACERGQVLMMANQPYSYVGLGAVLLVAFCFYMHSCAQPH
jgi:hypothetical protein